jgi:hypothetical protein
VDHDQQPNQDKGQIRPSIARLPDYPWLELFTITNIHTPSNAFIELAGPAATTQGKENHHRASSYDKAER